MAKTFCRKCGQKPKQIGGNMQQQCERCGFQGHSEAKCKTSFCGTCQDFGHTSAQCRVCDRCRETNTEVHSQTMAKMTCAFCKEKGHSIVVCPKVRCRRCNRKGHVADGCTTDICSLCNRIGHTEDQCWYCENCTEFGHLTERCFKPCGRCDRKGHTLLECTEDNDAFITAPIPGPTKKMSAAKKALSEQKCLVCNQVGHRKKTCPSRPECEKCGRRGHVAEKCLTDVPCEKCLIPGHLAKFCRETVCPICKEESHCLADCRRVSKSQCMTCGGIGHISRTCDARIHLAPRATQSGNVKIRI